MSAKNSKKFPRRRLKLTFIRWLTLALWILFVVMTLNACIGAEVLNGDADLLVESAMGCKINKHFENVIN